MTLSTEVRRSIAPYLTNQTLIPPSLVETLLHALNNAETVINIYENLALPLTDDIPSTSERKDR